jgi:Protein of unknown function (DUF3638)/Protein of unknown function (DUF3645)
MDSEDHVIFEAFELSSTGEAALKTPNALVWDFPDSAVAFPYSEFQNDSFQQSLAFFLQQASVECIEKFAARTEKAGSFATESRETPSPILISGMLLTLVEANGRRLSPTLLRKRVRDEVDWRDRAGGPWRRSPFWLLLRVAVQRYLYARYGAEIGRNHYKFLLCIVLSNLINDAIDSTDPELLRMLQAKLARRLTKLQVDKDKGSEDLRDATTSIFTILRPLFDKSLKQASQEISMSCEDFNRKVQTAIPRLRRHADIRDLTLSLTNSGAYLDGILSSYGQTMNSWQSHRVADLSVGKFSKEKTAAQFSIFSEQYHKLTNLEEQVKELYSLQQNDNEGHQETCLDLAHRINNYLDAVGSSYNNNPEQKSVMILTVMRLWVLIDLNVTKAFPLLMSYNPGIPPDALDVLHVPHHIDMIHLHSIQAHLQRRRTLSDSWTIFRNPFEGCFAERYFDESTDSENMKKIRSLIEKSGEKTRVEKMKEWEELSAEYENLEQQIATATCIYINDSRYGTIHDKNCPKCRLQNRAGRMKIGIVEHPLPESDVHAKAVIFEILCPEALQAYRNVTWRIIGELGQPTLIQGKEPQQSLFDYNPLRPFVVTGYKKGVSLFSVTKSFLSTHYREVRLPVDRQSIILPNGFKLRYYDTRTGVWMGGQSFIPSFVHHCYMAVPTASPFAELQQSLKMASGTSGPTSYEVVASQGKCPSGLNSHEFTAYQTLFSGHSQRWPTILIELGASNLNFSTEATTMLVSYLAVQAGPADNKDPLRKAHRIYHDQTFCEALAHQITKRLDNMSGNWRETHCMSMLLTLILRLYAIGPECFRGTALNLLNNVRQTTLKWIRALRSEALQTSRLDTSYVASRYAFIASLLCKSTFIYVEDEDQVMDPSALSCFIESSIALQDNLIGDLDKLPLDMRNSLVNDTKMVYKMRDRLKRAFLLYPGSFNTVVESSWKQNENGMSFLMTTGSFRDEGNWWFRSNVQTSSYSREQSLHYHLLAGHLLVDGAPIGKLPAEHRSAFILEKLFGKQSIVVFPSGLPGMTYVVPFIINNHQIHIGFRDKQMFIRACYKNEIMELIHPGVFTRPPGFDLPADLLVNCVHWLNLSTGVMEIRKFPDIWVSKFACWKVDVPKRTARRKDTQSLVDPRSPTFQRIARIFMDFESSDRITMFQTEKGLNIDLRRLELSLFVTRDGLLHCRQLASEIDPNQDAGTWYGLRSKIVIRDWKNPKKRSILVPFGDLHYELTGTHGIITIRNQDNYGRFQINDVLGRLDCPAEPRLLYFKAQLHAYTSQVAADPLTGRTGSEEALQILSSGICQPWTPINQGPAGILLSIARLSPRRASYHGIGTMQTVGWDPKFSTVIQKDEYSGIVQGLLEKSKILSIFHPRKSGDIPADSEDFKIDCDEEQLHLRNRSIWRRRLYERPLDITTSTTVPKDIVYAARGRDNSSQAHANVYLATTLLRCWYQKTSLTGTLSSVFSDWPTIGGFAMPFNKVQLSDYLNVDLSMEFGPLASLGRKSKQENAYKLMFQFGAMSFNDSVDMSIIRALISFTTIEDVKVLEPPAWPLYSYFKPKSFPTISYLKQLIKPCCVPYPDDERKTFGAALHAKARRKLEAAENEYNNKIDLDCTEFIESLLKQWPCAELTLQPLGRILLIDTSRALDVIKPEWLRMFQNSELSEYIDRVDKCFNDKAGSFQVSIPPHNQTNELYLTRLRGQEVPALSDLLSKNVPQPLPDYSTKSHAFSHVRSQRNANGTLGAEFTELNNIIEELRSSTSTVEKNYAEDLMQSLYALRQKSDNFTNTGINLTINPLTAGVDKDCSEATIYMKSQFDDLAQVFQDDNRSEWLLKGRMWPCVTPVTLLRCLASNLEHGYGLGMKERLIKYGESITSAQRVFRMEDALLRKDSQRIQEEIHNTGHQNWNVFDHPLWLLIEIEANILIRKDQVDVALATMEPSSGVNSVLQMNMGQGKTSCIMPMVVAELANTKNLVRVVVPKALLLQTAQLMQTRLGGLLDRQVRHVPFSRKTPTDETTTSTYYRIHMEMMRSSGVMVALPEQILSFMLSGIQRLSDGRDDEATAMIKVQNSLRKLCRDVLDESDVTLSTRTQLIYPSGTQATVDGYPHRWETAETVLRLVFDHLWYLQMHFSRSIEVYLRPQGGLPLVFFLRRDAEDALIKLLVDDVIRGYIPALPMRDRTDNDRLAVKKFISEPTVDLQTRNRIKKGFGEEGSARQTLHLLRGLFVHRILMLTLKKRYNVQYGLHPDRDPIAVPYHAKGVPSDQAEWGHPDVAILFTCLSFYFGGLEIEQLRQSLSHILKSDDPASGYDKWTEGSKTLPGSLCEWNSINIDDEVQLREIWNHLRLDMNVIDYYLNHFVFPRHAKQFDIKLQANGWDIPLFSAGPKNITTGFSGTNDNKTMLPLTIQQRDLKALSHTNAEVLTYLLQSRNRRFVPASDALGKHITEKSLLELLTQLKLKILIDAGAQILEMDNYTLAKTWLTVCREAPAAVYFDAENKPFVLYRQGNRLPLSASSYADNLGECLIYIDESHTRGTDLKLPTDARGALTLGLGQTKDHTVQAAMRLRQLGTTQSVTFIAPPEVHQSIIDHRKKTVYDKLDSHDVISWLLKQTASGIEQMQPLYFAHGMDFCQRMQAASQYPHFFRNQGQRDEYLKVLRQAEKQTLEQLYAPKTQKSAAKPLVGLGMGASPNEISGFMKELKARRRAFHDSGSAVNSSTLQEVEQEREVAFEVEAVREVQKPVIYVPLKFPGLHPDILRFIETGRLALDVTGVENALMALKRTSIGGKYGITSHAANSQLYVSNEFMKTVQLPAGHPNDNLMVSSI